MPTTPRVTAAGEGDEPFPGHVDDERLVIEDQRIGLPCPAPTRLMEREAAFERVGGIDLAGDEDRPVEQKARLSSLDDVEAALLQGATARGGHVDRPRTGDGDAALGPELRVEDHRQVIATEPSDQTGQPRGVIEVAVAAYDRLDVASIEPHAVHVVHAAIRCDPGVEQQRSVIEPLVTVRWAEKPCWAGASQSPDLRAASGRATSAAARLHG